MSEMGKITIQDSASILGVAQFDDGKCYVRVGASFGRPYRQEISVPVTLETFHKLNIQNSMAKITLEIE